MEQDRTLLLSLGERVKALRVTRGLSQEELAERAGMSLKHLGEIERAVTEPSITAVLGLAKGLEVRVLDLMPDPSRVTLEPKALSLDEWQRIYEMARHLAEAAERMVEFANRFRKPAAGPVKAVAAKTTLGSGLRAAARRRPRPRSRR
jgi:transcriptional regulator with XRE-family HTH domain